MTYKKTSGISLPGIALQALYLSMLVALPLQAQAEKLAYVDARRLVNEAPQGKDELQILEQSFSARKRQLTGNIESFKAQEAQFQKNALALSEEERQSKAAELLDLQRTLQRDEKNYGEDYERSHNQGLMRLEKLISEVIIELAKKEGIDLVLQQVVYASPKIDFTERVLKELKKRHQQKK